MSYCSTKLTALYRANNYQNEESEVWLGEWMKERDNRDQLVYVNPILTFIKTWRTVNTQSSASQRSTRLVSAIRIAIANRSNPTSWAIR